MPFKWDSPVLTRTNLRSLTLQSTTLSTIHHSQPLPLNRLLLLISSNPLLEHLSLCLPTQAAVLPLHQVRLERLRVLKLSGSHDIHTLIDQLVLPSLTSLSIEVEPRAGHDNLEDSLISLTARSANPPITELHFGSSSSPHSSSFYGGLVGSPVSLPVSFLRHLPLLRSLSLNSIPVENVLSILCSANANADSDDEDDDILMGPPLTFGPNGLANPLPPAPTAANVGVNANNAQVNPGGNTDWVCPRLVSLSFKNVIAHTDTVSKIIRVVHARNPPRTDGLEESATVADSSDYPARIRSLDFKECSPNSVGADVVDWLKDRIARVDYSETPPSSCVHRRIQAHPLFS
jgi:hypothetical protein